MGFDEEHEVPTFLDKLIWRFSKSCRYPQIIQVRNDHLSTETYGDLGIPNFKQKPIYCKLFAHVSSINPLLN